MKLIGTDVTGSNMTFLIGFLLGILKEIVETYREKNPFRFRKITLSLIKRAEEYTVISQYLSRETFVYCMNLIFASHFLL